MGCVINATPRPHYPRQTPGTHCIGGWVGPRAGLDECGKSRPPAGIRSPDQPARSESLSWLFYLHWHNNSSGNITYFSYQNTNRNSLLHKSNHCAAWQMEGEQVTCTFSVNLSPVAYRGGVGVFNPPPKFRRPSKIVPNSTRFVKTVKNCWI